MRGEGYDQGINIGSQVQAQIEGITATFVYQRMATFAA